MPLCAGICSFYNEDDGYNVTDYGNDGHNKKVKEKNTKTLLFTTKQHV